MDYTTLIGSVTTAGSIANWMNHSAVVAAAPTILAEAESFIYRRLRHFKMQMEATGTIALGDQSLSMPSDYLEDRILIITGTNFSRITRKTIEDVKSRYAYDGNGNPVQGMPTVFFNSSTALKFECPAIQAYPYELTYFGQPAALGALNTTNFLTSSYPRMVRCACMAGAAEFMKDAGLGNFDRTYWDQLAEGEIGVAQTESDRQQRSVEAGAIIQ